MILGVLILFRKLCQYLNPNEVKLNIINNKLLLFDFDGTLCDSASTIVRLMKKTCENLNLEILDDKKIRNNIGYGVMKSALIYTKNNLKLAERFTEEYFMLSKNEYMQEKNLEEDTLFFGAKKCINQFFENRYKLGIATNKSRAGLDTLLNFHDIYKYFSITMSANDCSVKPSPDMVNQSLDKLNINRDDCILIGDTSTDANCAKNAGIKFIGVKWGYNSEDVLKRNGAIKIIDNFENLFDYIIKNFPNKN